MVNALLKLMAPLQRRVMLMVGRCVIRSINDALQVQGVQVTLLADEVRTSQRLQEYGFTSLPLEGCEGVAVAIAGNRDHLIVVATDDGRYRPVGVLKAGESALYNHVGTRVILRAENEVEVQAAKLFSETEIEAAVLTAKSGATGVFTSSTGQTVTVAAGIVISIE